MKVSGLIPSASPPLPFSLSFPLTTYISSPITICNRNTENSLVVSSLWHASYRRSEKYFEESIAGDTTSVQQEAPPRPWFSLALPSSCSRISAARSHLLCHNKLKSGSSRSTIQHGFPNRAHFSRLALHRSGVLAVPAFFNQPTIQNLGNSPTTKMNVCSSLSVSLINNAPCKYGVHLTCHLPTSASLF